MQFIFIACYKHVHVYIFFKSTYVHVWNGICFTWDLIAYCTNKWFFVSKIGKNQDFLWKKKLADLIPLRWFWNIFKWLATLCIFFIITAILLLLHKWASGPLGFCWIYLFNVCHWPCHRSHNSCRNAILYSSKFGRYNGQLSFFLYICY